ncbi:hypothetical protein BDZ85DRAFT_130071 [Elsinoe ampelina]|uniref:Uncharacterized protein n=1 Tax=Elsinoe ampelina TaxID=302913 RepID=A0A6A6GA72_9PEZI|nr:hypothetical protein BDZ85DRAFT_130071 [Elsinoe ampelina]
MSVAVASMPSPHQLPLGQPNEVARSSPTKGYRPPTTQAERIFADGAKSSPSKQQREEPRGAYRAQSIRAIQEVNGDLDAFLEEVDSKRRQLDEQIHRYIKQKDREFKLFERDARIKYRNAGTGRQPHQSSAGPSKVSSHSTTNGNHTRGEHGQDHEHDSLEKQDALQARSQPQVADNGLRDPQATREREADLLGVFTPSFLPLLSTKLGEDKLPSGPASFPTPAAPTAFAQIQKFIEPGLYRANSDPVDEKDAKQTRLKLEKRTSSSGSESKNLVSVLKSPAALARTPKRKRVSLVVGDEVVAPSDLVNTAHASHDDQLEHAEHVERVDFALDRTSPQIPEHPAEDDEEKTSPKSVTTSKAFTSNDETSSHTAPRTQRPSMSGIASALATERKSSLKPAPPPTPPPISKAPAKPEPDVFNFSDTELAGEDQPDRLPSDVEDVDISPVTTPRPAENIRPPPPASASAKTGIPLRPGPSKLRTSSSSSSQPISPGFSRPSVRDDPVFPLGEDVKTPEIEQNEIYGSLGASMSLRQGSLGESFMERNAEELRKSGGRRRSSKELQV